MKAQQCVLTIGDINIKYSEETSVKVGGGDYRLTLLSLRYHKKMFQPGKIEVSLQLQEASTSADKSVPSCEAVNKLFLDKLVTLYDDVSYVAQYYYVYKVQPMFRRASDGQYVYIKLEIFSPDHKLTLDKYCRAYVNKKLGADILMDAVKKGIAHEVGFIEDAVDISKLRFLNYLYEDQTESDATKKVKSREFIHPYLVQYNESFFDFMARTANRCGEYFYYEDDILHLGLDDYEVQDTTPNHRRVDINKDEALSFGYEEVAPSVVDVADFSVNGMGDKAGSYTSADYAYRNEVTFDEFFGMNFQKNQFSSFLEELVPSKWKAIPELMGSLLTGGIAGAVAYVAGLAIPMVFFAKGQAKTKNKIGNAQWVLDSDGNGKQSHASEQYDKSNYTATLYGSLLTQESKALNQEYRQNLDETFFRFVSKGCQTVGQHLIRIDLGTKNTTYKLGQRVTFESVRQLEKNDNSSTSKPSQLPRYIVVEIIETVKSDGTNNSFPGQQLVLAPLYYTKTKMFLETDDVEVSLPCPPIMCPLVRKSEPQRAYVAESKDPEGFGRVCIRYPWQKKDDDSSPWIRMTTPYAPNTTEDNGGGFYFQQCVGDEVLVGYEGGNIEHPYVIGALYTRRAKAPRSGSVFHSWSPSNHEKEPGDLLTIASRKGHCIQFDDNGNAEDFLRSALPGLDLLKPLTNQLGFTRFDKGMNSCFSGGMAIKDKWGIYNISCSTTNRTIKIDSPFGSVGLNAFTGITINAPCGDVKIAGKNITLEAGNEIKMVSGLNVPKGESIGRDLILMGIAKATVEKTLAKLVDLTLVRSVIETLLKPIAGNMTIKSNRYMCIEAGKGHAMIPNKAYTLTGLKGTTTEAGKGIFNTVVDERIRVSNTIMLIDSVVDKWTDSIYSQYSDCLSKLAAYRGSVIQEPTADNFVSKCFSDAAYDHSILKFEDGTDNADKGRCSNIASSLFDAVKALQNYCKDIKSGNKDIPKDDKRKCTSTLKKVLAKNCPQAISDIADGIEKFASEPTGFLLLSSQYKRMLAFHLIKETKAVESTAKTTLGSYDSFSNAGEWANFIQCLEIWTGKSVDGKMGAVTRFAKEAFDNARAMTRDNVNALRALSDRKAWSDFQHGEILFSDKEGSETMNFENGGLNHKTNEDGFTEQIKSLLAKL